MQKLTSFGERIVKKEKKDMKDMHLESTLALKAYFKFEMPKSLLPKSIKGDSQDTELEYNLMYKAISLLPKEVLPRCILEAGSASGKCNLVKHMVEYEELVRYWS